MITLDSIKKSNPVLVVYPAGTGGEHISHTLSICSSEFEPLNTKFVEHLNQYHTICVINYSTAISNIDNFSTSIDARYNGDFVKNQKRIVLKDHPTDLTLQFYSKYLDTITVLFVTPVVETDYFTDLTFKKLAVRIPCPIDETYVKHEISDSLTQQECDHLIMQANQYPWVWRHELHILITQMREQRKLVPIEHFETLDKIKDDHKNSMISTYITTVSEYQQAFRNCHVINCDSLKYNSKDFWLQVKKVIPTVDSHRATEITNKWIEQNNKLGTN